MTSTRKSTRPVTIPVPPPAVPRLHAAVSGGTLRLFEDRTADRFEIVLDRPDAAAPMTAALDELLHANGFTPLPERPGAWGRAIDREAAFQDLIDAERVLLKAADLQPAAETLARSPKRGRR